MLAGCGGGGNLTAVTGTVTHNGKAVTGGQLTFTPILSGDGASTSRPAVGSIKPDGTFVVTTEKEGDGVAIGRHRISYSAPVDADYVPPEWDGTGSPPVEPKSEFLGLVPSVSEVQVAAGKNELKIELIAPPPPVQE